MLRSEDDTAIIQQNRGGLRFKLCNAPTDGLPGPPRAPTANTTGFPPAIACQDHPDRPPPSIIIAPRVAGAEDSNNKTRLFRRYASMLTSDDRGSRGQGASTQG